jgi:hypothetical protein
LIFPILLTNVNLERFFGKIHVLGDFRLMKRRKTMDKVAFNGRETMLTAGIKKGAEEAVNVVKASSILGNEIQPMLVKPQNVESLYSSPFAAIQIPAEKTCGEILNIFG